MSFFSKTLLFLLVVTAVCSASDNTDICGQYKEALRLYRSGEVRKAQSKWQRLLTEHKDRLSKQQVNSLNHRLSLVNKCLSLTSGDALKYINQATKIINQVGISPNPNSSESRRHLGKAQMLLDFAASNKNVIKRRFRVQADLYKLLNDQANERKTIESLLRHSPKDRTGNYRLAMLLLNENSKKSRMEAFERAKLSIGDDKQRASEFSKAFTSPARQEFFARKATQIAIRKARQPSQGSKYIMTGNRYNKSQGTTFKSMDNNEGRSYEHKRKHTSSRNKYRKKASSGSKEPGYTKSKYSVSGKSGYGVMKSSSRDKVRCGPVG